MPAQKTYKCEKCGREVTEIPDDLTRSDCCQAQWVETEPLPVCTRPGSAEHTRFDAEDEPCDDGRGG
ncbi:MAG: hypothetical protein JJV98_14250 [Desulfosarcina sp.]|nr:hypothetical protein [Desulfobacterales bacterium]